MAKKHSPTRPGSAGPVAVEHIASQDGRYKPQAFYFVHEALGYKVRQLGERRHLTAAELLDGIRQLALERFGLMARVVLEQWGVSRTEDFGEAVYLLIDHGLLSKTDGDRKEDFKGVYDFRLVFDEAYRVPGTLKRSDEGLGLKILLDL